MKKSLIILLLLISCSTNASSQSKIFTDLGTINFNDFDYGLIQKQGFKGFTTYMWQKDSMIFSSKTILNYSDSTMSITQRNKNNNLETQIIPMYDELPKNPGDTAICCPIRTYEYDSLKVKYTEWYPYSIDKLKIVHYYIYAEATNYLKFEIIEEIRHDMRVMLTKIYEYVYEKHVSAYTRKTYLTVRTNSSTNSYLYRFDSVNKEGLLIHQANYDIGGSIIGKYQYVYE